MATSIVFPGIDPHLEFQHYWPDFHARFLTYWCDLLCELLPEGYEAAMDERVNLVELPPAKVRRIEPDLAVVHRPPRSTRTSPRPVGTLEPVTVPLVIVEEAKERYIEIRHRPDRSLVGVLELLSPSNKEEPGRESYLAKRDGLLHQDVHVVELDLLLGGRRLPFGRTLPPGDYFAMVSRFDRRPDCDVYAWTVRDPLPMVPMPLLPPDEDVWCDLALVFAQTFERGRYGRRLDYDAELPTWLTPIQRTSIVEIGSSKRRVQPGIES